MSTKRQIDQTPTNQNTKPIFSVKEWCRAAGISECLYFKERREGRGRMLGTSADAPVSLSLQRVAP